MKREEIIRVLKLHKFREVDKEYEFTNKYCSVFVTGDCEVSILSLPDSESLGYLSIPTLKIDSEMFLFKMLKSMELI